MGNYAITLLELLDSKGHGVTLSPEQGVRVSHSSRLTKDLRLLIAACRNELISEISNTASAKVPKRPEVDERLLHQQYLAHHFQCSTCICAGQGTSGFLRCAQGSGMWKSYSVSTSAPVSTNRPKEPVKSHNLLRGQ
jgi:hypothetical protein